MRESNFILEKKRALTPEFCIFISLLAAASVHVVSFCYLTHIFGTLAMFCVHCQSPLSMTRIQYCFLVLCVWILILLTNTLMKTFGGLWNWLTSRTLYHPFLINWIMSVLRVVRTSGRTMRVCAELNHECAWQSSNAPDLCENLGRQLGNS